MDTDIFIVCIKTEDIYKDIATDAVKRFDASNYETDTALMKGEKVIELIRKVMKKHFY